MALKTLTILFIFTASTFSQQWSLITTTGNVPKLKNHSAIYISSSNSMIVYGGRNPLVISGELWSLNLTTNTWTQIIPNGSSPAVRFTQNTYYDSLNNRMIIWSGQGNAGALYNDVWAYNFSSNSWTQLWPDGNIAGAPLKRYGTASVFDPVNRGFVTFAGFTTSGRFEDTWTFSTENLLWFENTNNPHPPKRCLHSAVFAHNLRRMIIYAGQDTGPLDDIWSLDVDNFSWQNITPQVKPPARFWNSAIYSESGGSIIIFGGLAANALGDMWKFSLANNQWESVNQGSNIPSARWGHSAIYIPQQDRMIVFGGDGDSSYNDTWQFSNISVIGINQISGNVPKQFSLEQNYPNPFNPITNVKFQIPTASLVKLVIYDVLCREVTILVNEQLTKGTYEIDFDGTNLSSGVYFYRLTAGDYSAIKKMILIK